MREVCALVEKNDVKKKKKKRKRGAIWDKMLLHILKLAPNLDLDKAEDKIERLRRDQKCQIRKKDCGPYEATWPKPETDWKYLCRSCHAKRAFRDG